VALAARLDAGENTELTALSEEVLLGEKRRVVAAAATESRPGVSDESALGAPADAKAATYDVFVSYNRSDRDAVRAVVEALRARGVRAWLDEDALQPGRSWLDDVEGVLGAAKSAALLLGPSGLGPWQKREMRVLVGQSVERGLPVVPVLLPGADEARVPLLIEDLTRVDLRGGVTSEGIDRLRWGIAGERAVELEGLARSAEVASRGQALELPTGIRALRVPGGRFEMGAEDLGSWPRPVHPVRISAFWLAETTVTNAQYAEFLEATKHREPRYWRDKEYSRPGQPVVGVTWHDASAFCAWLSEVSGRSVVLPSEAQWEFAARGPEGRKYPWGDEEPDEPRARFGLGWEEGATEVGSHPAGRGPYGHLDLVGNVWEWCRDVWDEKAYAKRQKSGQEVVDPEVTDPGDIRCLRGGAFVYVAQYLRAAYRSRYDAERWFLSFGFRVAVVPASLDS
jgi:formylglycine-generating enzyme required for sulfatase activity